MKKTIVILLTIIMTIISPFMLLKNKEIVKAEEEIKYQVIAPQLLPSATYNSLQQLYDEETGIFTTTYKNNNYKITRIYTSGYAITLHIYNETNFSYFLMSYRYQNIDPYEYVESTYGGTTEITTMEIMGSIKWTPTTIGQSYIDNANIWNNKWSLFFNEIIEQVTTPLQTPILTINNNTLQWNYIENATYYNIFKNGDLYAQTTLNRWTTIENGTYNIQACTNEEGYSNSEVSNSITQDNYNDIIGNGTNFYTLFGSIADSQILLIKSMLDYNVWGINFYDLLKLLVMVSLTMIIIKIAMGKNN